MFFYTFGHPFRLSFCYIDKLFCFNSFPDFICVCDVYVEPDVFSYGITFFGGKKEILEKGYAAGEKILPELQSVADQIEEYLNCEVVITEKNQRRLLGWDCITILI